MEKIHKRPNSCILFEQTFIQMFLFTAKQLKIFWPQLYRNVPFIYENSLSIKLLWPTFTFRVHILGKIEKIQLVTNRCRYFDKQNSSTTTEGIHTKFCIKSEETKIIILGVTNVPTASYGLGQKCKLWGMIEYTFFMKNMFKGMYAPRLSHIHVEKTCFQIQPPLIPLVRISYLICWQKGTS